MAGGNFYVYIATNRARTLYTGVTNDLERRLSEHRLGIGSTFSAKYKCDTIVWYQPFGHANDAIACEKQIKGWTREKKIALIERANPNWDSLVDYR